MLRLKQLDIEGFGPFAEKQTVRFPTGSGVTVIYGENMRGKTSLLNAIRYAFFGFALGRGSRRRTLHTICNRENAAKGIHEFKVSLTFNYEDSEYQLVRECRSRVTDPSSDGDYEQSRQVRQGNAILGPQEAERILQQILPEEVSRFFLFDGELLQEYEELLLSETTSGAKISAAIERILGVPLLKRGKTHLTLLGQDADKAAAKEASKSTETRSLGAALQTLTEQKEAHQKEGVILADRLKHRQRERVETEQYLQSVSKHAFKMEKLKEARESLEEAASQEKRLQADLHSAMAEAWRTLIRGAVQRARGIAHKAALDEFEELALALRRKAILSGHCSTCDRKVPEDIRSQLRKTIPDGDGDKLLQSPALARLARLDSFADIDNHVLVRQTWEGLSSARMKQVSFRDTINDIQAELADADPDEVNRKKVSYSELLNSINITRQAIEDNEKKIQEKDGAIQSVKKKLAAYGTPNLAPTQRRAEVLKQATNIFGAAVDDYKTKLRKLVEERASELFLQMTTEKEDYEGLTINESYGLSILHRDGRLEEARSAGAEHVVALALMGALQNNAPLRGPIVMDSPFGRLDERHTGNVVKTLPMMAEQVVLLVYEAEVGKSEVRRILGKSLAREYELARVSARRTNIIEVN